MNTLLWILQILLAAFFFMAGFGKLSKSRQEHIADGHISPEASVLPVRILGVVELLCCLGILIPWLTGIMPILTPVSGIGFCLVMIAGLMVHTKKKEYQMLPMLVLVLIIAAFVSWQRFSELTLS